MQRIQGKIKGNKQFSLGALFEGVIDLTLDFPYWLVLDHFSRHFLAPNIL